MQKTIKGLVVTLRQSAIKHLKKDYKKIDLLEALNAFYQIRGIVSYKNLQNILVG